MWRCVPSKSRGEPRTLVDNVVPYALKELEARWPHGPGRFRMEFRDAKRIVARVQYIEVAPAHEGGGLRYTKGRRAGPRIVPPPRQPYAPAPRDLLVRPTAATATLTKETSTSAAGSGSRDPFITPKPPPPSDYRHMLHATAGWITHPRGVPLPQGYVFAENSEGAAVVVPEHRLTNDYVEALTPSGVVYYAWNPPPAPVVESPKRPGVGAKKPRR